MTTQSTGFPASRLYTISGRVQGVWFRDSTRRKARELDVSGYAINLDSGDVEVYAVGSPEALDELERWLLEGPPLASVAAVERRDVPVESCAGFIIG